MSEPRRLLEDPRVAPELRRDLAVAARPAPVDVKVAAAVAAFEATLLASGSAAAAGAGAGATVAGGGGAGAAGAGAASVGALMSTGTMWIVGAGLAIAVGVGGAVALKRSPRLAVAPSERAPAVATTPVVTPMPPPLEAATSPSAALAEAPPAVSPAPPRPARLSSHASSRLARPAVRGSAAAPSPPAAAAPVDEAALRREVSHVALMRKQLDANPAAVLTLGDEARRIFGRGVLAEEREALEVLALERLGRRSDVAARGAAYLARFPRGPFSERIRRVVQGELRP